MIGFGRIARVFVRRTSATPTDALAFVGPPPMFLPDIDEVHVSIVLTGDIPYGRMLAKAWEVLGVPVKIGGPAFDDPGGDFTPGMYVADGYLFTSRGCPNRCDFCMVPGREGGIRELPIHDGWNVLDSNLLACSDAHVRAVFEMLARQKREVCFTGGLEAARFKPWPADLLAAMTPQPRIFFAFDYPSRWKALERAAGLLRERGMSFDGHRIRAYCLIGYYDWDTPEAANERLQRTLDLGVFPMAMLYQDADGRKKGNPWPQLHRRWASPTIIGAMDSTDAAAMQPTGGTLL